MKQFTLSSKERLKSRKQIDHLFSSGKFFNLPPLRVVYELKPGKTPLQFGVAVSARNFKKAVDRNRVKRLTREAWRLQKTPLQELLTRKGMALSLFVIYTGRELPEQVLITERISAAINRLAHIADEKDPVHT